MRVSGFLLFFLSYATLRLAYATPRRILHQPFFPLQSPPSQTPSPSPPSKPPFSQTTPENSSFFPFSPSPPPPPSPSAFATLPANFSSLILPHSPQPGNNSQKILAASLAAAFFSLVIVGIFIILHRRRTNDRDASDDKTYKSDNGNKNAGPTRNKIRTASASSEFLYLGTIVNSRNLEGAENGRNSLTNDGSGHGKLNSYSPELRPLPPLNPRRNFHDGNTTGDENEEFYSPRGSLTQTGSESGRVVLPVDVDNSGSISSSSETGSPDRSNSPSMSPPVSSIPPPKTARVSVTRPPPPPPPLPVQPMQIPTVHRITSRPPPLIPPSRPFRRNPPEEGLASQNGATKRSPVELPPPSSEGVEEENTSKPKLKALHWDKVRASSGREMVWDHLRSSSFILNEEMMETLFVVNTPIPKPKQQASRPGCVIPMHNQENRVLDPKKAQNIAILLRALNVTIEEVCDALLEGNADTLGPELLESLMKMAPTKEEERKLKDYKDDSPTKLGHAEKFLKAVLDVPFAFKRVEAMLYIANFETEVEYLKRSFETLELACKELRNSRMFLKLLEAVLKTGNRMNVGTNWGDARAFKLYTLLKLVDVKGVDGKTTLLHFVVQEIIRTEGARISGANQNPNSTASEDAKCRKLGLQVVSALSSELANVKKAAGMDSDILSSDVSKLSRGLQYIGEVERLNETLVPDESSHRFSESMKRFMKMAKEEIIKIQAQESVALSIVKEITEYFHGNSAKEEAHPFRIFMVVRDFLSILDRVCKEVGMINERTVVNSACKFPVPVNPTMPQVFSGPNVVRQCSSSDEES